MGGCVVEIDVAVAGRSAAGNEIGGTTLEHHEVAVGTDRRCPIVVVAKPRRTAVAITRAECTCRDHLQRVVEAVVDIDLGDVAGIGIGGVEGRAIDDDDRRRAKEADELAVAAERGVFDRSGCVGGVSAIRRRHVTRIAGDRVQNGSGLIGDENVITVLGRRSAAHRDELAVGTDDRLRGIRLHQRDSLRRSVIEKDLARRIVLSGDRIIALEDDVLAIGTDRRNTAGHLARVQLWLWNSR